VARETKECREKGKSEDGKVDAKTKNGSPGRGGGKTNSGKTNGRAIGEKGSGAKSAKEGGKRTEYPRYHNWVGKGEIYKKVDVKGSMIEGKKEKKL